MKYIIYCILIVFYSCKPAFIESTVQVSTMGTTGSIKYISKGKISYQKEIDSILLAVNMSMSTYIDSSTISLFNSRKISLKQALEDKMFEENFLTATDVWHYSNQLFNPAILPLINYWKVQNKSKNSYNLSIDSFHIDSLVKYINSDNPENKMLDFSALAKGYGVDMVANFLESKSIENYMVEIGGELNCKGKNIKDNYWKIGIEEPNEKERKIFEVVQIINKSMATSGNYRNFKKLDSGQKIVHIINPKTGYPEISNLLSASIISDECMIADAYATACMLMGLESCFQFVNQNQNQECYLIYSDKNGDLQTKISDGFKEFLK